MIEPKKQLTKSELRAERRAIQDQQRTEKMIKQVKPVAVSEAVSNVRATSEAVELLSTSVIAHLSPFENRPMMIRKLTLANHELHPSIVDLGLQMAAGSIDGANTRCVAMMAALKAVIREYSLPNNTVISRDMDKKLRPMIQFLNNCRPISPSMECGIKYLKMCISRVLPETSEIEVKVDLCGALDKFVHERIVLPGTAIAQIGGDKISDGDVVLTYSQSDAVLAILANAKYNDTRFRVIVVDSRPYLQGRNTLNHLHSLNIDVTYVLLHAISYIMREVTKVLVGADAILSNGVVLAIAGTAAIAMMATTKNIPVLVCCESYKLYNKVQLDSICSNELGDSDLLVVSSSSKLNSTPKNPLNMAVPKLLHLRFDIMPCKYVSVIITEHGLIPPSACAVLIRELEYKTHVLY